MAGLLFEAGKGTSNATHKATIRSQVGLDAGNDINRNFNANTTAHNSNNNEQNKAVGYSTSFHTGQAVSNQNSKEKGDFDYVVVNEKNGKAEGYMTSLIEGELVSEAEMNSKLKEVDKETLEINIKKLRELADKYEESAKKILEASSYCTTKELSVLGIGVEDRITECAKNYQEMAKKLREYAKKLEAQITAKAKKEN